MMPLQQEFGAKLKPDSISSIFFLFAGLFGYYSLNQLRSLKLYNLDFLFDRPRSPALNVIFRYALGTLANLLVASSFVLSYLWFAYLTSEKANSVTDLQLFPLISIIISSSSLILISHRFIGGIALIFKNQLFYNDIKIESSSTFLDFKKHFLDSSKPAAHLLGAILFLILQMFFGLVMSLFL